MGGIRRYLLSVRDDPAVRVIVFQSADPEFFIAHVDVTLNAGHGSSAGAISAMDGAIIELAHRAYTSAFHSIFGVLAVLSILTAVVCIVTLRCAMQSRVAEATHKRSCGDGKVPYTPPEEPPKF